ncbi:39S ribosomal protein L22, mitochondrial [Rhizina undulata]
MNVRMATRWLARPVIPSSSTTPASTLIAQQVRHRSWFGFGGGSKDSLESTTRQLPITELLKQSPKTSNNAIIPSLKRGSLAPSSIFGDETADISEGATGAPPPESRYFRDPERKNWGWPRKADLREHRRRGRLTRTEKLKQLEKEHQAKSHFFKTSMKKLAPLARQITGKSLEDAIVQMRFSPKKAARDVLGHLHHAKNEAIVRRRMDPAEIYISQAWVGKGTYDKDLNHRARGRVDILNKPHTSITVILKEEVTRKRLAQEAAAKKAAAKPWIQLPSKPIYGQRQYYQW